MLSVCSCSTLTKTANVAFGTNGDVVINPITANVDLENAVPVEGNSKSVYIGLLRLSGGRKYVDIAGRPQVFGILDTPETRVKSSALYDALTKADCDLLLSPLYTTSVKNHLFGIIKVYDTKVKGFGANIKDLNQVQPGDPDYDVLMGAPTPVPVRIR